MQTGDQQTGYRPQGGRLEGSFKAATRALLKGSWPSAAQAATPLVPLQGRRCVLRTAYCGHLGNPSPRAKYRWGVREPAGGEHRQEPPQNGGPRLSLPGSLQAPTSHPAVPKEAHLAAMATASMETGSRGCGPRGRVTGSPSPQPACLLCSDASPGRAGLPGRVSGLHGGASSDTGDGVEGEEVQTLGSK